MIRHVSISTEHAFSLGSPGFAWFDTVTDKFLEFSEEQAWETWEDFVVDWQTETRTKRHLQRFIEAFPQRKQSNFEEK